MMKGSYWLVFSLYLSSLSTALAQEEENSEDYNTITEKKSNSNSNSEDYDNTMEKKERGRSVYLGRYSQQIKQYHPPFL